MSDPNQVYQHMIQELRRLRHHIRVERASIREQIWQAQVYYDQLLQQNQQLREQNEYFRQLTNHLTTRITELVQDSQALKLKIIQLEQRLCPERVNQQIADDLDAHGPER